MLTGGNTTPSTSATVNAAAGGVTVAGASTSAIERKIDPATAAAIEEEEKKKKAELDDPDWKEKLHLPARDDRKTTEDVASRKSLDFESMHLRREVLKGIFEMGYERPSPVQVYHSMLLLSYTSISHDAM
jgi:hypothetical protein